MEPAIICPDRELRYISNLAKDIILLVKMQHFGVDVMHLLFFILRVSVENIYKFRSYFEQGYELIVASRMGKNAHNEEDDKMFRPRKWFVLLLALAAKILYQTEGNTVWDVLHGFRGMTRLAFHKMSVSNFPMSFDIETCCRAYKLKIKRIEFPVWEKKRIAGKTHFKAMSCGWNFIKYLLWELSRKD